MLRPSSSDEELLMAAESMEEGINISPLRRPARRTPGAERPVTPRPQESTTFLTESGSLLQIENVGVMKCGFYNVVFYNLV